MPIRLDYVFFVKFLRQRSNSGSYDLFKAWSALWRQLQRMTRKAAISA